MPVAVMLGETDCGGPGWRCGAVVPFRFPVQVSHRPPSAQAIRLAGDALMGVGAHRRSRALLLTGAAVIVVGWSNASWPLAVRRA